MALLRRGDLKVTQVCFAVGCSSLGTFSTRFTELVGVRQAGRGADRDPVHMSPRAPGLTRPTGRRDPQARIYRREEGRWRPLAGGLPDPLPAIPYALLHANGRLFAGLADGQIWESRDGGDSWQCSRLAGDPRRRSPLTRRRGEDI